MISDDDWYTPNDDWLTSAVEVDWTFINIDWLSDKSDTIKRNKTQRIQRL